MLFWWGQWGHPHPKGPRSQSGVGQKGGPTGPEIGGATVRPLGPPSAVPSAFSRAAGVEGMGIAEHPTSLSPVADRDLHRHVALARVDPSLWSDPSGRAVLEEAKRRYAGLAQKAGLDPADGATHAWHFWSQTITVDALDQHRDILWQYTGGAIRRTLAVEAIAQDRLIDTTAARHLDLSKQDAPIRFSHATDILSGEVVPNETDDHAVTENVGIAAIRQLLVMAGLTPAQRDLVFDHVAQHAVRSANIQSAARALLTDGSGVEALFGPERWRALVTLMVGSPKGTPGIIRLIGDGHPAPMSEPHISRLVGAFLDTSSRTAAGVA